MAKSTRYPVASRYVVSPCAGVGSGIRIGANTIDALTLPPALYKGVQRIRDFSHQRGGPDDLTGI